jgi:hypothetical protein
MTPCSGGAGRRSGPSRGSTTVGAGTSETGYGNNWVIAAVVVRLPMISRPVAISVLAKLVIKDTSSASRLWLARRMAGAIAGALPAGTSTWWPIPPTLAPS